ncbi:predicted protein [Lichtheimia corymbifera JMRC:FSU:9682]|uniref:Uncharacterized protein n=1 Tax=Lichtheimia corymbifera JMRC:FSU:9682 TaxID=1263082 RepID=A0A068RYG2_9FUNG|nr:predicted protein [Lichtheimia corymbifera JMRC:FSU:9682]
MTSDIICRHSEIYQYVPIRTSTVTSNDDGIKTMKFILVNNGRVIITRTTAPALSRKENILSTVLMDRAHHLAVAFEEKQRYQLPAWKMDQQTESSKHFDEALGEDTANQGSLDPSTHHAARL